MGMIVRPVVRVRDAWERETRKWATANVAKQIADRRRGGVELFEDSPYNFAVQYNGKMCEAALCEYFHLDFMTVVNLIPGKVDHHDVALGPILMDSKGTEHPHYRLLIYSITRLAKVPYDSNRFTHLVGVRYTGTPQTYEIMGWMTKEELKRRKYVAPDFPKNDADLGGRAANLKKGTWYVPYDWTHPIEELRRRYGGHEIVPRGLRARLGWHDGHDAVAQTIIAEFDLVLPRDRELIRQLAFVRARQGPLDWL